MSAVTWDVELPLRHGRATVRLNGDPTASCLATGCARPADLVVRLHGERLKPDYPCCVTDHWLAVRRLLIDRGNDIDYAYETPALIIRILARPPVGCRPDDDR
jgi:hypothetical protein